MTTEDAIKYGSYLIAVAATWLFTQGMGIWKINREGTEKKEENIVNRLDKAVTKLQAENDTYKLALDKLNDRMRESEIKAIRDTSRMEHHINYLESMMSAAGLKFTSYRKVLKSGSEIHDSLSDEVKK